jgi:hypothetical protein
MLDSRVTTAWTGPPEYVFEAIVEHMQGKKEASANFRLVCHAWRAGHDRLLTILQPKGAPQDAEVFWRREGTVLAKHFGERRRRGGAISPHRSHEP